MGILRGRCALLTVTFTLASKRKLPSFLRGNCQIKSRLTHIIDLGFALAASSGGSSGAKAAGKLLRAQTARAVTNMCLNEAGANIQSLCTAIGGFLAAPGILDISLNPEEPIFLNNTMENIDDATKLGLKATFTPGK